MKIPLGSKNPQNISGNSSISSEVKNRKVKR
jgi:hypothetical protein